MATSTSAGFRTCPNGHPVLTNDRFCTTCGVAVPKGRAKKEPAAEDERTPPPPPETPDDEDDSGEEGPDPETKARRGVILTAGLAGVLAIAGAVMTFTLGGGDSGDTGAPVPARPDTGFATACDGAAYDELTIGTDTTTNYGLLCFAIAEHSTVTIDAAPVQSGVDLLMTVSLASGEVLAEDDDTNGLDPEIVFDAQPGTYLLNVLRVDGGSGGTVMLSSSAVPAADGAPSALPTADQCGSLGGPTIVDGGTGAKAAGEAFTCLTLSADGFAKIGIAADDPGDDLTLAVYRFDAAGEPQFVRSVDDTFGYDPELNLDLTAGDYLIEAADYEGNEVGSYSLYVNTDGTYFRTGPVSSGLATLHPGDCGSLPAVTVGTPLPFGATAAPRACLSLASAQRLVIRASTNAAQDLTLEIVGFEPGGKPVRYVWADEDVFGEDFDSQDPRVDLTLPAGTYVLAVAEYWGAEAPHDFTLSVTAP